jgi:aspartate/methionine/tyrosine aminotransferase
MMDIMKKITKLLNRKGYLCIVDLFYNGYLYDKAPSKIIYTLTSCKNPIIKSFSKKMGAESAGVGVCFLSKSMWLNLFNKSNLNLLKISEKENYQLKWYKKYPLFIKSLKEDNVMIAGLNFIQQT